MIEDAILDSAAQKSLARLARMAIEAAVTQRPEPSAEHLVALCREYPTLGWPLGAFVTIYVDGELRGCLGEVEPEDPLAEVVARCARRVPLHDYRFAPVRSGELGQLTFKVSVLSMPAPVESPEEIELGVHGLIVRQDGHTGLLLPEVPLEYGWDRATFLRQLWHKAGLKPGVPLSAVRLWRFTSHVIDSEDFAETGAPGGSARITLLKDQARMTERKR
jgi:AmmeMemoRadiSam system protein A